MKLTAFPETQGKTNERIQSKMCLNMNQQLRQRAQEKQNQQTNWRFNNYRRSRRRNQ